MAILVFNLWGYNELYNLFLGGIFLNKYIKKVLDHPKMVVSIYVLLLIFSIFSYTKVDVNYHINDYLPSKSKSTIALKTMEEEFDEMIPNVRVMLKDVSINQTLETIEELKNVDGVMDIIWLDDFENLMKPSSFMDEKHLDNYYKNNSALIDITVDTDKEIDAVEGIREIIGPDNAMTGSAVNAAMSTTSSIKEIAIVTAIGFLFTILILILTTDSYIEPLIILIGLVAGIVINAGTNIIFGQISFVTNAAGNILLLAVSLDYTVFILHRYKEERGKYDNYRDAIESAVVSSYSSIFSSALTTIIGFIALVFMQFKIGQDMGLALAKGIFISLITVFTLTPVTILYMDKFIDRTSHKNFMPSFDKLGNFVLKKKNILVILFALVMIPCFLASQNNDYYFGNSHVFGENTQVGRDKIAIEKEFGKGDNYALLLPKGNLEKERELSNELKSLPEVKSIVSYVDSVGETIPEEFLDKDLIKKLNSDQYTRMILSVLVDYEGEKTVALIEKIEDICEKYYGDDYHLAGEGISTFDLKNTVIKDMAVVNIIAISAVFLVLLFSLKSLLLPVLLLATIEAAILINMSVPYFRSSPIFYISYLIISSIQLGATVDYAILLTERYDENRKLMAKDLAVKNTISQVAVSIMTSASAMIIVGFLLGKFSSHGMISQIGYRLSVGATASFVNVLFVLPGLLYLLDGAIQKTTKDTNFVNER